MIDHLQWDLSSIKDARKKCWETPSLIPTDVPMHTFDDGQELQLARETCALILASTNVHLREISTDNIGEWLYRLECLQTMGRTFLAAQTEEGIVPLPIAPSSVMDHVGLRIYNVDVYSPARFNHHFHKMRREFYDGQVTAYLYPQDPTEYPFDVNSFDPPTPDGPPTT